MPIDRITTLCFLASYVVALGLEIVQLIWPRPVQRLVALVFGGAGLLAQTLYLAVQVPSLATHFGSLLMLAWVLAVFYFYGALHYKKLAWAVFVLPLVIAMIALAELYPSENALRGSWLELLGGLRGVSLWNAVHGTLLLLAAVGVCIGFLASVMYLIQARRLRAKVLPGSGMRMLSLERLEEMNRRAINLAFPLLTAGMLIGVGLMLQRPWQPSGWTDPRVLSALVLWLVFALVLYLRYGYHVRGRHLALLTIVAFGLLMVSMTSAHSFGSP